MLSFQFRPSLRWIQQLATIERFAGHWDGMDREGSGTGSVKRKGPVSEKLLEGAIRAGSEAALALDPSTPAHFSTTQYAVEYDEKHRGTLSKLMGAHSLDFSLELEDINRLHSMLLEEDPPLLGYRKSAMHFCGSNGEPLFPTVSAFLVEERLAELLKFTKRELASGVYPPLALIGTFQLLFMQIYPYEKANVSLCQIIIWKLLVENGYGFIAYSHLSPVFLVQKPAYLNALRQAEKSAYDNWSSLNIWLEFFLEAVITTTNSLSENRSKLVSQYRLTPVQKQIIEVVQTHGAASRDKISKETGINVSTIKYNLSVLANNGQLKRDGGGRTTSYSVV